MVNPTQISLGIDKTTEQTYLNENGTWVPFLSPNYPTNYQTIANLRSSAPAANQFANVEGYYAVGDGGGGQFYGVTGGTYTDNGGTIITTGYGVTATSAWLRVQQDHVNVRWFGAMGDNTNQTTAIQNAVNAAVKTTGKLIIPLGGYYIGQTIIIQAVAGGNHTLFIEIDGYANILYEGSTGVFLFDGTVNGSLVFSGLSGGNFIPQSAGSAYCVAFHSCYHPIVENLQLRNYFHSYATNGIYIKNCYSGYIWECYLDSGLIGILFSDISNGVLVQGGEIDRFTQGGIVAAYQPGSANNFNVIDSVYIEQCSNSIDLLNPQDDSWVIRHNYINQDNLLGGSSYAIHVTGAKTILDGNIILNSNVPTGIKNEGSLNSILNNKGSNLTGADYFVRNHTTAYGAYVQGNTNVNCTIGNYVNGSNAAASNILGTNFKLSGSGSGSTSTIWT